MAQDFAEQFNVTVPLFTDPSRKSYELAGWRRPLGGAILGLGKTVKASMRAMKGGFRQGRTQGDAFQLGGVLVIAQDGRVLMEHRDSAAGDHASLTTILAALEPVVV